MIISKNGLNPCVPFRVTSSPFGGSFRVSSLSTTIANVLSLPRPAAIIPSRKSPTSSLFATIPCIGDAASSVLCRFLATGTGSTIKRNMLSLILALLYIMLANFVYLARRAHVRRTGGMTVMKLLKIRLEREPQVSWLWYGIYISAWQIFALGIFPWLEPLVFILFKHVSFYYSYPNANGFGFIVEPIEAQELPLRKRQKAQKRLDWHKFTINVGPMDKFGYRHPPKKTLHLPHVDAPQYGLKHWPWDPNSMQQGKVYNRPKTKTIENPAACK